MAKKTTTSPGPEVDDAQIAYPSRDELEKMFMAHMDLLQAKLAELPAQRDGVSINEQVKWCNLIIDGGPDGNVANSMRNKLRTIARLIGD